MNNLHISSKRVNAETCYQPSIKQPARKPNPVKVLWIPDFPGRCSSPVQEPLVDQVLRNSMVTPLALLVTGTSGKRCTIVCFHTHTLEEHFLYTCLSCVRANTHVAPITQLMACPTLFDEHGRLYSAIITRGPAVPTPDGCAAYLSLTTSGVFSHERGVRSQGSPREGVDRCATVCRSTTCWKIHWSVRWY